MKKKDLKKVVILLPLSLLVLGVNADADTDTKETREPISQAGKVKVKDSGKTSIVDPEDPDEIIDPGPGPSTNGVLRIDYVSQLDFGHVKITQKKRNISALATSIGKSKKVGSFIQISDFREKSSGWVLQVKQEHQFKTADHDELTGAVLSFDKGWANSLNETGEPEVTRDTLSINELGASYDVARAVNKSGTGIWSIAFGASKENEDNQPTTIKEGGKSQLGIRNSAVTLSIPDSTKILPKEYQTKITWILAETP